MVYLEPEKVQLYIGRLGMDHEYYENNWFKAKKIIRNMNA